MVSKDESYYYHFSYKIIIHELFLDCEFIICICELRLLFWKISSVNEISLLDQMTNCMILRCVILGFVELSHAGKQKSKSKKEKKNIYAMIDEQIETVNDVKCKKKK